MKKILALIVLLAATTGTYAQQQKKLNVIAYFMGGPEKVDSVAPEKLSHIIFSFCHLTGNRLTVDNSRDSVTLKKLVALKKKNPALKVILSLGGWGGCAPCSDVFSSATGRQEFAASVLKLNQYFKSDGIDLDWEYPAIEGHPGHAYKLEDKKNFTELIKALRKTLGQKYEISFAAGGFQKFLDESVEWKAIMPLVDRVNLMTYDLINGYSVITGHHTALYSTPVQHESTDNAVQYLIKIGVPANKLVIGAAFYARVWENVEATDNGVNQSGKFLKAIDFHEFPQQLTEQQGFTRYWDNVAKAPYSYNATKKLFATYDDKESLKLKTEYAMKHKLDGIMFWELMLDAPGDGLLDSILDAKGKN